MRIIINLKILLLLLTMFNMCWDLTGQEKQIIEKDTCYQETIILNTDREIYVAGEKIWFKLNCYVENFGTDTLLSKIVYLELYDFQSNTIVKEKYRLVNNKATGFLNLPIDINTGNYYLRAYTLFMRNFSPQSTPTSFICVLNPEKPIAFADSLAEEVLIVPDGGKLIKGVSTKLAIRIGQGLNKKIKEAVVVNNETEIIKFSPFKNGLAAFEFTPVDNSPHFLKFKLDDSSVVSKQLPPISEYGFIMQSELKDSQLIITLVSNGNDPSNEKNIFSLELKDENFKSFYISKLRFNESIKIDYVKLPNRLIYIVLRNQEGKDIYVSSKIIEKIKPVELQIIKNKESFLPREHVELRLISMASIDKLDDVQISAVKTGTYSTLEKLLPLHLLYNPVFLSNYLKTNDINSDILKAQLDVLQTLYLPIYNSASFMEALRHTYNSEWLPELRDVGIRGTIVEKGTKNPLNNIMVYASVIGDKNQFHVFKTDIDGVFYFSLSHLLKKQNIFITTRPIDTVQVEILINNDFSTRYPTTTFIPMDFVNNEKQLFEEINFNHQVNKSFNYKIDEIGVNQLYSFVPVEDHEFSVELKEFIKIPVMSEIFNEIVPLVSSRKTGGTYHLNVYDKKYSVLYQDPLVLVDGVPVFDINEVMKISPENVDKINVNTTKYYIGDYTLNGLIRLYTKTKNFAGISFPVESVFLDYQTITPESYPVFPDYGKGLKSSRIPDFRNLLFWDAKLKLTESMNTISFYTSDAYGDYDIIIRGYDKHGNCIFGKTKIGVEKPAF